MLSIIMDNIGNLLYWKVFVQNNDLHKILIFLVFNYYCHLLRKHEIDDFYEVLLCSKRIGLMIELYLLNKYYCIE